jgi:aminoglycoside phosphotransferase (APT) family kinase protein
MNAWDWAPADLAALERLLDGTVGPGPLTAQRIGDGHSNLTFLVSGGGGSVVVRRPPPPPVPSGAHDVLREATLLRGLVGTGVPVPTVLATAAAGEVVDSPLYVMSHVRGPVVTTRTPAPLATPAARRAAGESLADTLAALHAVDWRAAGLSGMGRPEGFNARHHRRMRGLLGSVPPEFAEMDAWLAANVPAESGATIVHGDYRLGNVVLAPDPPGLVAAVLDWELATLGDPLLDVGYLLASWPQAGDPLVPTAALGVAALEPGWPTRAELAQRYAAARGIELVDLRWYTALSLWKLAVLYEYSRRRGTDPYFTDPALVTAFLAAAERATG